MFNPPLLQHHFPCDGSMIRGRQLKIQSAVYYWWNIPSCQCSFSAWEDLCLVHLLGLSHLQVLSLSSSCRDLQSASVFLQEHKHVSGSWRNLSFLLSEHVLQQGSHWVKSCFFSRVFFPFRFRPLPFRGFLEREHDKQKKNIDKQTLNPGCCNRSATQSVCNQTWSRWKCQCTS